MTRNPLFNLLASFSFVDDSEGFQIFVTVVGAILEE